jgi:flavin-dependent dehydrogenase
MQSCEVLVVGAGPAGSTCAKLLSRAGLSVLLMDSERFPREKPCAGWITPAVLETLEIDPQLYRKERLLQEIREFRTGVFCGGEIVTDYGRTVSYGIRRSEFDHFLLLQSGAPSLLGEAVTSLERVADGWLVNGRIRTRLLIGAGGHRCPVARALGAHPGKEPAIVGMVAEWEMGEGQLAKCRLPAGYTALSFTRDMQGYGWLLRKGNFLNVGLGSLAGKDLRRRTAEFCEHLRSRGDLPDHCRPAFQGHAYLHYPERDGRRTVGGRALLIGDAAGVSFAESGEGILPAIESGVLAAQTVLAAAGDYRLENLTPYAGALAARFGGKKENPLGLKLPGLVTRWGGAAILSNGWLTRHLVLDRWFLHQGERLLDCTTATSARETTADLTRPQWSRLR